MVNLGWIQMRHGTAQIEKKKKKNRQRENTEVNGHLGVGKHKEK